MQSDHFDALIVGAGPAGASAAILLASAGWSVALVEKQVFPRRKVCGECVAASNLPLLDALGIGVAFGAQAGPPLRQVALMRGNATVTADLPRADHPRHAWGRALGRETLDTLLLARAQSAGATVFVPWSVQDIQGAAGDHRCVLREVGSGLLRTLHARVAILAHGSWEPLPAARAARRASRSPHDLIAFKANFSHANLAPGLLPVLAFDGGYGGMVLGDGGLATLAGCVRADRLDALRRAAPGVAAGAVVEAMLRRDCAGVESALDGAGRQGAWLASGPLAPGVRLRARGDALLRIGNAAGEAHPIVGEGMSMALQSAFLLCEQLLASAPTAQDADWHAKVSARHAARWRRRFVPRLALAAAFAHAAMRPAASQVLIGVLARWPGLLTQGARWCGKVDPVSDSVMAAVAPRSQETATG